MYRIDRSDQQPGVGTWAPGDRLPSERALTDEYGLSRPLVRETLRRLEERGYIQALPARDSFVRSPTASDASRPLVRGLIIRSLTDPAVRQAGEPLHATIADAIAAGDRQAARDAMYEHLSLALQRFGDDLDQPLSTVLRRRAAAQENAIDVAVILSELDSLA